MSLKYLKDALWIIGFVFNYEQEEDGVVKVLLSQGIVQSSQKSRY